MRVEKPLGTFVVREKRKEKLNVRQLLEKCIL